MPDELKMTEKKITWVEATTNQATRIVLLLAVGAIIYLFEQANNSKQAVKANEIQWKKISIIREDYWKAQVAQAYKNGCMETAIKYLGREVK